jgi:hypothetical protein
MPGQDARDQGLQLRPQVRDPDHQRPQRRRAWFGDDLKMRQFAVVVLLAVTLAGCKTGGLTTFKLNSPNWSVSGQITHLVKMLYGSIAASRRPL